MMRIEAYHEDRKELWDEFVRRSKNGTFMHLRDFIEYHRDRFDDHSLLVWNHKDKLLALLPANKQGDALVSHAGLTYGGFVLGEDMRMPLMLEVFEHVLTYLKENAFSKLVYKTIPHIHHKLPSDEDIYALYLCGAKVISRDVWPVIKAGHKLRFQERRRRGIKKAKRHGLAVKECNDFKSYWRIVSGLLERYGSTPVHSLEEIEFLRTRFPDNVRLFACYQAETMIAGVLIFESDLVARAQYIAASDEGKRMGALDLVFDFLINEQYREKPFFDFGPTTTNGGLRLNKGLSDQKEGFGARTIMHDRYELDLRSWKPGSLLEVLG